MDKPLLIKDKNNKVWEITLLQEGSKGIERFLFTNEYSNQTAEAPEKIKINSFIYPFNMTIDTNGYLEFEMEDFYG